MILFDRRSLDIKDDTPVIQLLVIITMFLTLAFVAVSLRFVARSIKGLRLAADDYWIALALVMYLELVGLERLLIVERYLPTVFALQLFLVSLKH